MTVEGLKDILRQKEGMEIEFKQSHEHLPRNVYESVCAFLNRRGGHVVLGVDDDGKVVGINRAHGKSDQVDSKSDQVDSKSDQVSDQVGKESDPVSDQVEMESDQVSKLLNQLVKSLGNTEMSAVELMTILNLTHRPSFRKNYLHPALELGIIEYTLPDELRSPNQKYRLTSKGRLLLNKRKQK